MGSEMCIRDRIWNLEALNVNLGVDCNNAHVQPNGKYHYHGTPTSYLNSLNASSTTMTLIGYAADGFPVYYKYAYSLANNSGSDITIMTSSYRLKSGNRPGDGVSAPCDSYNGVYSNDYEYINGLGTFCLLYTSPSPRDLSTSRMPSSA